MDLSVSDLLRTPEEVGHRVLFTDPALVLRLCVDHPATPITNHELVAQVPGENQRGLLTHLNRLREFGRTPTLRRQPLIDVAHSDRLMSQRVLCSHLVKLVRHGLPKIGGLLDLSCRESCLAVLHIAGTKLHLQVSFDSRSDPRIIRKVNRHQRKGILGS